MSDLMGRKPRVVGARMAMLRLTPDERVLVARIDGESTVADLAALTGLGEATAVAIVTKLSSEGAIAFAEEPIAEFAPDRETERDLPHEDVEPEEVELVDDPEDAAAERSYRQLYEQRWHPMPSGERAAAARTLDGPEAAPNLLALCFDPDPQIIAALIENATCGLDHVRLIAQHHRTTTGLEIVTRRRDWLHDMLVERRLLRNSMIGDVVLGRVMSPKRLFATYKIAIDRDLPDLTRAKVRGMIRPKWQGATPEERADLLLRTEARCLTLMTGCTFDAKTTQILCGRPISSAMFVQSVAKFGASPPGLLAHLVKQPFVRKNAALKKMLISHPNIPGDAKRSV